MRWLQDGSTTALAEALRQVAPALADHPIAFRESPGEDDPTWWSASTVIGERYVAKYAWSRPAAHRLAHEITMLEALAIPYLPEVVASSTDPLLLVTKLVPGRALFDVANSLDLDQAGGQLAHFLSELHDSATHVGDLPPASLQPVSTDVLRERFPKWVRPEQRPTVSQWCDWTDEVLATPGPSVLVHGDLHGGNQIWRGAHLRAVLDFETAGLAEAEYDLRCFPGTGPGAELLTATQHHYEQLTGRTLATDRVMAWHVRTTLGDALWRSEAAVPLPDHRTPPAWIEDLAGRFTALDLDPLSRART
ncbi:phosphotransferase family protein [Kribbella sp. NPDC051620]|uniref:phosphotransferase family protein n=1 Tax=Kribbella sp. NPDC051620 TaxID=3364120 RepID=UPI0037B5EE3D